MNKQTFDIAVLIDHPFKPGADPRIIRTVRNLRMNGFKLIIIAYNSTTFDTVDSFEGIPIHRIIPEEYSSPRSVFGVRKKTANLINETFSFKCLFCNDQRMLDLGARIKASQSHILLVYDAHEYFQDYQSLILDEGGFIYKLKSKLFRKYETRKEISNSKYIDQMITISKSFADLFMNDFNLTSYPIIIRNIPCFPEEKPEIRDYNTEIYKKLEALPSKDNLIFFGNFYKELNGLENVFIALKQIDSAVTLILVGDSKNPEHFDNLIANLGIKNRVLHIKRLPQEYMPSISKYARVSVVPTMKTHVLQTWLSLPNKFFDSIKMELPLICTSLPEHVRIIEAEDNGILVDGIDWEKSQEQIPEAYQTIMKNYYGFKEKAAACNLKFDWQSEYASILSYLKKNISHD